jgi:hypothetical protein
VEENRTIPYAAEKNDIAAIKTVKIRVIEVAPIMRRISPNKLIVKGPAKFIIIKINHIILKVGLKVRPALLTNMLRE